MTLTEDQVKTLLLWLRVDNLEENDLVAVIGNSALSFCERYCAGTFVEALAEDKNADDTDSEYMNTNNMQILFTPDIWQAVMLLTAYWYGNREAIGGQMNDTCSYILDRHRIWADS